VRDKALVKKMRAYNGAGFFDLDRNKKDDDDADYDSDTTDGHMAVHQGSNVHHFDSNMTSLTAKYGLIPFPGFVHAEGDVTWSLPDGVTISFDLFDYYSNSRLSKNWEIIKRWLMMHGAHVTLHYATGNKFQIGCSCGIVAARILTWIVQNHGAIPSNTNEAVLSSVLKAASTVLCNAGLLHSSFAGTNKTKFLSETSIHMLACDYMKTEADMGPPTRSAEPVAFFVHYHRPASRSDRSEARRCQDQGPRRILLLLYEHGGHRPWWFPLGGL